jgi:hypothetical protein
MLDMERLIHFIYRSEFYPNSILWHPTKAPASSSPAKISIPWLPIQEIVHASKSHVLLLLDCCYAMASIHCRGTKVMPTYHNRL